MSAPFYTAAGDRAAGYNGENAYGRYQRWLADAQHYAASKGRQVDPADLAEIARGGIKYAEEHGFGPTGFDFTGAQSNTLNPGEAVEYLAAGNRPNRYQTDERGLTVWQPGLGGAAGGASAAGAFDAYAGHGAGPDWGAMLANPVQPPATAAFDSGPGGPLPSTPTGTTFPGGGGADPYAGYGATPAHWTDALQAELGGHTMSAPMGSGMAAGATAGMGAPAPPVGGGGGGGGTGQPFDPMALMADPQQALRWVMQRMGLDPNARGKWADWERQRLAPMLHAYLLSNLSPNAAPSLAGMADEFGRLAFGGGGDLYGAMQNAATGAIARAPDYLNKQKNQEDAADLLGNLVSLQLSGANPIVGQSLLDQFDTLKSNYGDVNFTSPGGAQKGKFATYAQQSPFWGMLPGMPR